MATLPDSVGSREVILSFTREHGAVQFIRLQWQDYSGVLRGTVLLVDRVLELLLKGIPFKSPPYALECVVDNSILTTLSQHNRYSLLPDWSSLRQSVAADTATVMCGLEHLPPGLAANNDRCPRHALERVMAQAHSLFGLDLLIGFEVEFVILNEASRQGYCQALGHHAVAGLRDPAYKHIKECVKHLTAQGVAIHNIHTEGVRGQYEITLGPLPPMQAVDQVLFVQDCIKEVFASHGYQATMSPKPFGGDLELATGQHFHISVHGKNATSIEESFLAGILNVLPGLCGICMPRQISYLRLGQYLAGDAVGWGTESRLVPVRKIQSCHWEMRCVDATANMYLAVASVIAAGLRGVNDQHPLTWPDLATHKVADGPLGSLHEKLPEGILEALGSLEGTEYRLAPFLGRGILNHYLEVRQFEAEQMEDMELTEQLDLLNDIF
ncbi:hypothetical protein PWT90_00958 [Aphanocladium album]|nr:hypothetical protein PWT90_00958 [Aphanocladium album]